MDLDHYRLNYTTLTNAKVEVTADRERCLKVKIGGGLWRVGATTVHEDPTKQNHRRSFRISTA